MNTVFETIERLRGLSGKAKAIEFGRIKQFNPSEWVAFIDFAKVVLDTDLSFHIKKMKATSHVFTSCDVSDAIEKLMNIHNKGSAGKLDKQILQDIYNSCSSDDQHLIDLLLARKLRCGITASSIRKYIPTFLPTFPVMLCSSYNPAKILTNIIFPAISQLKSDGARCIAHIESGLIACRELMTRNGKYYTKLGHIADILAKGVENRCVDGELVVVDENGKILPRKIGNGILNKSIKGTITDEEASRVRFIVWDVIDVAEYFGHQVATTPYTVRLERTMQLVQDLDCPEIIMSKTRIVKNLDEAKAHYRELLAEGEEGTILKDMSSVFQDGRSVKMFKFKQEVTIEVEVTGTYAGNVGGKYETMIGGLNIKSRCGSIVCNVGSGLSDEDRAQPPEYWIGKIISCTYNERISREGSDTQSLFLPRVVDIRFDKEYADDLVAIMDAEALA